MKRRVSSERHPTHATERRSALCNPISNAKGDPEMHRPERSRRDRPFCDPHSRSCPPRAQAPCPQEHPLHPLRGYPIPGAPNVGASPSLGDPVSLVTRREVLILVTGTLSLP